MVPRQAERRFITYYRVSTERQGRSGLGLDAQRTAVQAYLRQVAGKVVAEFTEIQSGKDDDRPQLTEALQRCKLTNSTLLIAKLDRLSRNVAFLATLQQSGTRFIAADLPEANELVVHIMAAVAQSERKTVSIRTKDALQAAKAKGVKLGNPHLKPGTKRTALIATRMRSDRAQERAEGLRAVIEDFDPQRQKSLRDHAEHLNGLGITTPRGGPWHANSVRRVYQRLAS